MEALNVQAEFRKFMFDSDGQWTLNEFVSAKLAAGDWVEDDGDYYTREEWDSEEECGHYGSHEIGSGDGYVEYECDHCAVKWTEDTADEPECGAC